MPHKHFVRRYRTFIMQHCQVAWCNLLAQLCCRGTFRALAEPRRTRRSKHCSCGGSTYDTSLSNSCPESCHTAAAAAAGDGGGLPGQQRRPGEAVRGRGGKQSHNRAHVRLRRGLRLPAAVLAGVLQRERVQGLRQGLHRACFVVPTLPAQHAYSRGHCSFCIHMQRSRGASVWRMLCTRPLHACMCACR